jgi:hypothetical protein
MTDDEQQIIEVPTKRGRPKGSTAKRRPLRKPMHNARDDEPDIMEGFEYRPYEQENPLSIDLDIVRSIENEWGYSLLWVCFEANGKPFPNLVSARKRNGYAEVKRGNFGGLLDHMVDRNSDGIRHEGLVLMARPMEIQRMAQAHDKAAAKAAIENMRKSHSEEGVSGISMPEGGRHPSALQKNRHRTTYEEGPEIPD